MNSIENIVKKKKMQEPKFHPSSTMRPTLWKKYLVSMIKTFTLSSENYFSFDASNLNFGNSSPADANQPIPKRQTLYSSKLKEFADDNFKFSENGRKFFERVKSTVGKGEIARNEQFLLFPQCFQKTWTVVT